MANNHINFSNRDFDKIREDLVAFGKQNYPELSDNFGDDASITSFLMDLMAECMDSLNFHIDRVYQNTQVNATTSRSALMNLARSNGLKIPGPKASMCEVKFSCRLPVGEGSINISEPNWSAAPTIKRSSTVSAGAQQYILEEDVDFGEQFNNEGYSNRTFVPRRNANGVITDYLVTKSAMVSSGQRLVYKKVLNETDITPFMEVILNAPDVMCIESIIFKESADINVSPNISEYFIDEEEFLFNTSAVKTHRYFEVNALTDQWRFGAEMTDFDEGIIYDKYQPEEYEDYTETSQDGASTRTTRIYRGAWKPIRQKFITEYTDNGYMKIIFGSGVDYELYPTDNSDYGKYRMGHIINNDMMGVLPKAGWTMFVLYRTGGGSESNVAKGAINTIKSLQVEFNHVDGSSQSELITPSIKAQITNGMSVTSVSNAVAGRDMPSTNEIKNLIKYNTSAQERCVSVKDYHARVMQMPPKYGAPFRTAVMEENNKIVINMLGLSADGKLDKSLPSLLAENIVNYLSHYKSIGSYVELKSGLIYHIGLMIDAFIDKNYSAADVIAKMISTAKSYMAVKNHEMGEDIFIGDLEKELNSIDGVISLIELRVYKMSGGGYSGDKCPLPVIDDTTANNCSLFEDSGKFMIGTDVQAELIDLSAIDSVLIGDAAAMYEIKNDSDIQIRVKQR